MTLTELEASFLKRSSDDGWQTGVDFGIADGVMFLCPQCFKNNNGPIGTHSIICWFTGKVPNEAYPRHGRWNPSGDSLTNLTFVEPKQGPKQTSVLLTGGCGAHFYVEFGRVRDHNGQY